MSTTTEDDQGRIQLDDEAGDRLVAWRRHLHAHPELSNAEHATAAYIVERLAELGIDAERVCETGVVAVVEGAHPGPTLGWRADIDALPIVEDNDVDYRSRNPGVMHACGHDVHTTVGLGLAAEVQRRRDALRGRVKFIFQPAEEASPAGEPVGAEQLAQAGVLADPDVDAIFACHCMPSLEVGKIGFTGGGVWAGSDLVEIAVHGQKAHGAYPHEGVDAALVASHIVVALQSVVSRHVDARKPCVLTVGKIVAGNSYNILAETAELTGILRALDEQVSQQAQAQIRRLAESVAQGFGARATVRFTPGARPVVNDAGLEARAVGVLRRISGDGEVVQHPPQLGAEDFAAFSRRVAGAYFFLGIRNAEKNIVHPLHTPKFDVDEACLTFGVERFATMLLELSKDQPTNR